MYNYVYLYREFEIELNGQLIKNLESYDFN